MKIGIDVSQIIYETGVSWYTKHLVENLLRIDSKDEFVLFGGSLRRISDLKKKTSDLPGKYETKFFRFPPTLADIIWNRLHFPKIEKFIGALDVFHSSDWAQPPSDAFKVTTVHDLWPVLSPRLTDAKIVAVHRRRLGWVLKEADRIIVPSMATKSDLVGLGAREGKIRVIYEGPDTGVSKKSEEDVKALKKKYAFYGEYLLSVGVGVRKNTERIIDAYQKAKKGDLKLVIIGKPDHKYLDARGVRFVGHVPQEDMGAFYSGAKALVYPSLNEGFGLPILDAFSCETPVVTSNISSMAEVAGTAAILVDPMATDSIAQGIRDVLARPKALTLKGTRRLKDFSWEKAAKETLEVYREC